MKTSEQLNEISTALAKAQGELTNVTKDKVNPHFKKGYASLDATLDTIRAVFAKNGLALVQGCELRGEDIVLCSRVVHASGQWIQTELPLLLTKDDMQGMGAGISYARRYLAQAMAGIAQADEDNDGQGASKKRGRVGSELPDAPTPELLRSLIKSLGKTEPRYLDHLSTIHGRALAEIEDLSLEEACQAHVQLKDLLAKQTNGKAKNGTATKA